MRRRRSVTRGRSEHEAVFEIYQTEDSARASGKLYWRSEFQREFDVAVRSNHIAVDTGTGSGVKVRFRVEERH